MTTEQVSRLIGLATRRSRTVGTNPVTDSNLDWSIARITNLTDRQSVATLRAGYLGRDTVGWFMSRADIAAFLVAQLTDTGYRNAAPAIIN